MIVSGSEDPGNFAPVESQRNCSFPLHRKLGKKFEKVDEDKTCKISYSLIRSNTVFENHRKSLISHFLRLYFKWAKVDEKCQKWSNLGKVEGLRSNSVTRHVSFNKVKMRHFE